MKIAVIYNKRQPQESDVINVFGMPTREHYNPKTVERVAAALEKGGHNVRVLEGNMHVVEELQHFMPRVMRGERPGMVFNMAYGIQGQSRYTHIPAMLEMLGIPYVGSAPAAHAIALDKVLSKVVFEQHQLPTPRYWVFSCPEEVVDELPYPLIVKPRMEAVSLGLRIVNNEEELREATCYITEEFKQQALVEEFIPGREFAVGLLGNRGNLEIFPIVEFDFGGNAHAIQTLEDKLKKPAEKICPADIPAELAAEFRRLTREAFYALGLFDLARVDFRMDNQGRIHILELNSMASLGLTGSYVHAARVAGYTYESLVNRMIDVAAVRYFGESFVELAAPQEEATEKKQPLSTRIRSYLRSNLQTMEDYLQQMVKLNTYVYNIEGVNMLGNWMSNRLGQLRLQRFVHPQVEIGNMLYFSNHAEEQSDILLLGHLDTAHRYQDFTPFREERGRYYGSGVAQSKGGLVVLLTALQALRFARVLRKVRCGILLTTDETVGARSSRTLLEEMAQRAKYVVATRCGDMEGGIITSCSGTAHYQIQVTNLKSGNVEKDPNVVSLLAQKVRQWQKLSSPEEGFSVSITAFEARVMPGGVPDHGTVSLVTRFNEKAQRVDLDKKIRQLAAKALPKGFQAQVTRRLRRPPHPETDANRAFFERIKRLADRLEIRVNPVHSRESSPICFVPEDTPALDGLGPIGGEFYSGNEHVVRDSLIERAALLASVIRECGREG